jgi:asparagine synthase (glutamine-hydrolysing)
LFWLHVFSNAPDPISSHKENVRLLENLHYYDCLRVDRAVANCGLEARVPFLDLDFINLYLSIDPNLRVPLINHANVRSEKYLLRESFKGTNLLPDEVLFRKKEAFSDGVSSTERSWYKVIQEKADKLISDEEFKIAVEKYTHLPPTSKEALYFRKQFEELYGKNTNELIVPDYWLPKWSGDIKDPSARLLNVYHEDKRETKS